MNENGEKERSEKSKNENVVAQALSLSSLQSTCGFLRRGKFIVDEKDCGAFVGDLSENAIPGMKICGGIQVGDWIFTVEQSKMTPENGWYIGGLFSGAVPAVHATFCQANVTENHSPQKALLEFVATKMWPIFHPEEFREKLEKNKDTQQDIEVSWNVEQFDNGASE